MQRRVVLLVGLLLWVPAVAQAVSLEVPSGLNFRASLPGQKITFFIGGASQEISGSEFDITVGAGGPLITAIDTASAGHIFATQPNGTVGAGTALNSLHVHVSNAANPNVFGPGNLITVTFDGTGKTGQYAISLTTTSQGGIGSQYADGDFNDQFYDSIVNGVITFVPEPSSIMLGLFAAAGLGMVMIRKHRARRAA